MRPSFSRALFALALLLAAAPLGAGSEEPAGARFLRFPDIHGATIVFSHGGDLWTVPASGGTACRLTAGDGLKLFPRFSPDGKWIAFTGQYDGTWDVYVIPASGGPPRRLTWYPSNEEPERLGLDNMVIGWTPDGRILFRGQRGPLRGFAGEPYTVSPEGGPVTRFPLPESGIISFSPDGKKIAYNRIFRDFRTWKRYQGGQAQDVFIYDLGSQALERITDWPGTDSQPMWIGNAVYFLSDREDWKLNIWRYDLGTKATTRMTSFREFDVKWPHAGGTKIVFENAGELHLLDTATGEERKVDIQVPDDKKLARKRWVKVDDRITDISIAPGGARAAVTARGEVFTVPAEQGPTRNVTRSPGVREKNAAWSPDGRWIAFWSDATGEEELTIAPQDGKGQPIRLTEGPQPWHFAPVWSPDSRKLAYADRELRLFVIDVGEKKPVLVDTALVWEISRYTFSPDSKWLAYAKAIDTDFPAIFLYSLVTRATTRLTAAGMRSFEPVFDPDGRYLYFLSDRDLNPVLGTFEASFTVNKATRPYALVLKDGSPPPFAPKSDEAKLDKKEKEDDPPAAAFRIDLKGLADRLVPFPVQPGSYSGLSATRDRVFYLSMPVQTIADMDGPPKGTLHSFDLERRKDVELLQNVDDYDVVPDGSRLLYKAGKELFIVEPREGLKAGDGKLDLSGLRMEVDPPAEWAQIYHETWRIYRDFFYLADMGKLDWPAMGKRYERLLPYVTCRADLSYLLGELAGELGTGHAYVGGGDQPKPERVPVGLLGADLVLDRKSNRWAIGRILEGQNWMESRRSPLTEPGVAVSVGDYVLAIDGRELTGDMEPYSLLVGTVTAPSTGGAGLAPIATTLLVNSSPTRAGAREVTVRPVASEEGLRYYGWVEGNRRRVETASAGRVGYVHIPDMAADGLQEFVRQYFPQLRKEALIVDVRSNGGGFVSEMVLERLRRAVRGMEEIRNARPVTYPSAAFNGPMVAIINAYSSSDGDIFPYYFREFGLGPLIGKRTWGGVVGIREIDGGLVDGGYIYVPEFAPYDMKSRWLIENEGVAPDIDVDDLPADELAGKDAQLERGIAEALRRIAGSPPTWPPQPPSRDLRSPVPRK